MYNLPAPFTLLLGNLPTLVRMELTKLLHNEPDLRVVGAAEGAGGLVAQARRFRPGLVVVPENQLLEVEQLARQEPTPVLLYSPSVPLAGMLREAARWGVFDFVRALEKRGTPVFEAYRRDLLRKIRSARQPEPAVAAVRPPTVPMPPARVLIIGGSTGGAAAVESLLRSLRPMPDTAILVAVHLPAHFTDSFVKRLQQISPMPVVAGVPGTILRPGTVVVAPGGQNTVIQPVTLGAWLAWQTALSDEAAPTPDVPSIDLLLRSAARTFGRTATGLILTGLGTDGTLGAHSMRQAGGHVLVQDEASAAVFSMPKSVISAGLAQAVLPLHEMPAYLSRLVPASLAARSVSSVTQFAAR